MSEEVTPPSSNSNHNGGPNNNYRRGQIAQELSQHQKRGESKTSPKIFFDEKRLTIRGNVGIQREGNEDSDHFHHTHPLSKIHQTAIPIPPSTGGFEATKEIAIPTQ